MGPLVPRRLGSVSSSGTGTLMPPAWRTKNLVGSLVGLGVLDSLTRAILLRRWLCAGSGGLFSGRSVKWSATKFDPGPAHIRPSVHSWPRATGDWGGRWPLAAIGELGNVLPRGCLGPPGPEGIVKVRKQQDPPSKSNSIFFCV